MTTKLSGFKVSNYLKYDFYHQRLSQNELSPLGLRERDFFFGVINKASYRLDLGRLWIEPRWKSEFRYQSIDLTSTDKRRELTELGGLILGIFPYYPHTSVQAGLEFSRFDDFENDINDFNGVVSAVQFSNDSAYLGYQLTTRMGLANRSPQSQREEREHHHPKFPHRLCWYTVISLGHDCTFCPRRLAPPRACPFVGAYWR